MRKVLVVVGTRPNFIKITQLKREASRVKDIDVKIVHTGQHFDDLMSKVFFNQFDLVPDYFLDIERKSANSQIASIMMSLERLMQNVYLPDILVVVGDVNSTLAAALTANKLGVKLAHLESGLRSLDRSMPEEINRILTDELSDLYFVTEQSGIDNLVTAGVNPGRIKFVGNTMIDSLVAYRNEIEDSPLPVGVDPLKKIVLMTVHRPATVDNQEGLMNVLSLIETLSKDYQVVFPIHPRTKSNLASWGLDSWLKRIDGLFLVEPLDYFGFQKLISSSRFVITDSGGIQEETTFLGIPCLTIRPNTERPVTVQLGTNTLVPFDLEHINALIRTIEVGTYKSGKVPPLWDGKSTERIIKELVSYFSEALP